MRVLLGMCAAVGWISLSSSNAWALETGQCLPAGDVRATLAAENQTPIVVGNRTGYGYPVSLIFFSNEDGSRGYLIRGDKPLGQQAKTVCVDSVYRDVRLNDIAKPGVPSWAKLPVDRPKALALCAKGGLGYQDRCDPIDTSRAALEGNGAHVMLFATGTTVNPRDKSVRRDQRIIVTVEPNQKLGLVDAVTSEGASYRLSAYTSVSYTQHGEAMLAE